MKITIEFYGRLKQQFDADHIEWVSQATTIKDIYTEICHEYNCEDESNLIKPIINDSFCDWHDTVSANSTIGFLPPASGG
jgi:molybdopterin synthase sulfur carrier subunit